MADDNNPKPEPNLNHPVCPHCLAEPILLQSRSIAFPNGLVTLMAWCGNPECRKVLSVSFMGMNPQRTSGLVIPN